MKYTIYNKGDRICCRVIRKRSLRDWWTVIESRLERDPEAFENKVDNFIINLYKKLEGLLK